MNPRERGPYRVGVKSFEVESRDVDGGERLLEVDVWYPADLAVVTTGAEETFAAHPFGSHAPHLAIDDLMVSDEVISLGPRPLVAFSHGNGGLSRQSTFLTTFLASWGFLVCAPNHAGNTFLDMQAARSDPDAPRLLRQIHFEARRNRPLDIVRTIETVHSQCQSLSIPLPDLSRLFTMGHSYGGWTSLKVPALLSSLHPEWTLLGVVPLAPASEPFVGKKAFGEGELASLGVPCLIISGNEDTLVDFGRSVRPIYDRLAAPKSLINMLRTDHFHFCDAVEVLQTNHKNTSTGNPPVGDYSALLSERQAHSLLTYVTGAFFRNLLTSPHLPFAGLTPQDVNALFPEIAETTQCVPLSSKL